MTITMVDKSGQPRSDADIKDALDAMTGALVKQQLMTCPQVMVMAPTIIEALQELLTVRRFLQKAEAGNRPIVATDTANPTE